MSPGEHKISLRGDCGNRESITTEGTITLLATSPHTDPFSDLACTYDENELALTATWTNVNPSVGVDVYRVEHGQAAYVFSLPGNEASATLEDVDGPEIGIGLQFFGLYPPDSAEQQCYGTELIYSCFPGGKSFIRGLCSGVGDFPDIATAVFALFALFRGANPPCREACDFDKNGAFDTADAIGVLTFLFLGTASPAGWEGGAPSCEESAPDADCLTAHEGCGG